MRRRRRLRPRRRVMIRFRWSWVNKVKKEQLKTQRRDRAPQATCSRPGVQPIVPSRRSDSKLLTKLPDLAV